LNLIIWFKIECKWPQFSELLPELQIEMVQHFDFLSNLMMACTSTFFHKNCLTPELFRKEYFRRYPFGQARHDWREALQDQIATDKRLQTRDWRREILQNEINALVDCKEMILDKDMLLDTTSVPSRPWYKPTWLGFS